MEIEIRSKALKTLDEVANYLDSINTFGAGSRWLDRFFTRIEKYAQPQVSYALCNNVRLANRNFSCIIFKNWVIAFKVTRGKFVIYEIIHGSLLY